MKSLVQYRLFLSVLTCFAIIAASKNSQADDWPQWGGPKRDIVWREKGIVKKFSTSGLLPRVWSSEIGEGYGGPAVAKGKVYVMDFVDRKGNTGNERVVSLDAVTGKILWKQATKVSYRIGFPAGPRCTPVINDGRVYTLGAMGHFFCLDAETGTEIWKKNFVEDYGTQLPIWGMVPSPLVDGNQVISLVGGKDNALIVSFDKKTGKELWRSLEDGAVGYSPPMIYEFGGKRQLVVWHPKAISSLDPKNGKVLWEVPFRVKMGLTIATPRKVGNRLFVTAFYDGPLMVDVAKDGKSAKMLWKGKGTDERSRDGLHSIISSPWMNDRYIYGVCSYGEFRCLDAKTGKRLWETYEATGKGRWWNAFVIPHEDRYFIHNEQGDLIIAHLSPEGYEELSRAKLVEPTRPLRASRRNPRKVIWSHPAFAMKSVFARNDKKIVRVNLSAEPGK